MRAVILVLAISIPALASAQDSLRAAGAQATTVAQAPAQTPAAAAPQPPPDRRRRGSMVGYIMDAAIETQLRVRFDAGYDNTVPDRSEFFYAQCGCNDPAAPGPGAPGAGDLVTSLNFQQLVIDAQYAPTERIALFASLPMRFVQPQTFLGQAFTPPLSNTFGNEGGLSDIRAGAKGAIVANDDTTLAVQVQASFQSGDAKKGLGTDHASFETALLYYQRVSDRVAIESQFGDWHPFNGSTANGASYAGDVLFYGIGPSFDVVRSDRVAFAPVIELVGWHVLGGLQQEGGVLGPADGTNIVNLKLGARTTIDDRNSFYVGYGHALTDAVWYSDIVRFEYRYSF